MSFDTTKSRSYIRKTAPACLAMMGIYTILIASHGVAAMMAPLVYALLALPTIYSLTAMMLNTHSFSDRDKRTWSSSWLWTNRIADTHQSLGMFVTVAGAATLLSAAITIAATGGLSVAVLGIALSIMALGTTAIYMGDLLNQKIFNTFQLKVKLATHYDQDEAKTTSSYHFVANHSPDKKRTLLAQHSLLPRIKPDEISRHAQGVAANGLYHPSPMYLYPPQDAHHALMTLAARKLGRARAFTH